MLKLRCVFKARDVLVTTVERVKIKMLFTTFRYNLYLRSLYPPEAGNAREG